MNILIPLDRLCQACDPFDAWDCGRIEVAEIEFALNKEIFHPDPVAANGEDAQEFRGGQYRTLHIARIAHLVRYGWTDAIQVDVGIPSLHCWPRHMITDGNHRTAAGIVRRDSHILAEISGSLEHAQELFGVEIPCA